MAEHKFNDETLIKELQVLIKEAKDGYYSDSQQLRDIRFSSILTRCEVLVSLLNNE